MSSPGSHQDGGGNEGEQSVVKIDPDGDLTLVVGKTKTRFLVCSKALSRSAPFWKRCLYGPFKEAKPAAGREWVVEFPEDNPSGLECLLLLVHGSSHKMPHIDLQLAFEITVLTDKYDMNRSLWPIAELWLHDLQQNRPDESDDDSIVPHLQWIWVTNELGDSRQCNEAFGKLSQLVSMTTDANPHLLLRLYELEDAGSLTRDTLEGYDAEKDVILLIAGKVKAARQKALSEVQSDLEDDIKDLQDAVGAFDSSKGCDGASFCRGLKRDGSTLRPTKRRLCEYAMQAIVNKISAGKDTPLTPLNRISMSVEDFMASAVRFTSSIKREIVLICGHNHQRCTPFRNGLPFLGSLEQNIFDFGWAEKAITFQRQDRLEHSAARKRSRDEFEALTSSSVRDLIDLTDSEI